VWAEADTLSEMLWQVTSPLGVPCVVCRGNSSLSQLYVSAYVIAQRWAHQQRTHIVYVGDFDPAGMDMSDNLHARLEEVGAPGDAFSVRRVALTEELIASYHLPAHKPKETDKRTPAFIERYGSACVEVDALPPSVLAEVVEDAIHETIADRARWDDALSQQQRERSRLRTLAEQAGPILDGVSWEAEEAEDDDG
jgi:hypothetical protein